MKCNIGKAEIVQNVYLFILMWYAFFASSTNVLRPFNSGVWVLLAITSFLYNKKISYKITKLSLSYVIMCIVLILNLIISQSFSDSLSLVVKIILYIIITMNISSNEKMINKAIKFAYAFLIFHLAVIYLQLIFPNVYNSIFLKYIPDASMYLVKKRVASGVAIGFNTQTGVSGFWMTLGLTLSYIFYITRKNKKSIFLVLSILFACAVLLTLKRIFLLISVIVILFLNTVNSQKKNKFFKIFVIMTSIALIFFILASIFPNLLGTFDKMAFFIGEDDISNGRFELYKVAIRLFFDNFLFGIGYGAFATVSNLGMGVHNAILQTLTELGVVGFIIFWIPLLKNFLLSYNSIKKKNEILFKKNDNNIGIIEMISVTVQIIILIWCLTGNPLVDDTVIFIFLWMQMISLSIIRRESLKEKKTTEEI